MLSTSGLVILVTLPFYACLDNDFLLLYENHISPINESLAHADISELCQSQLGIYYKALIDDDLWAQQMFDAHAKVRSGLLTGNMFDLGDFDECLNISTEHIIGKYCLGTPPDVIPWSETTQTTVSSYTFAVCVPDKCTADDASKIYSSQTFTEQLCYSRATRPELTSGGIAAIATIGFFLLLAILSTSYSLYLYYNNYNRDKDITVAFSYFVNGRNLITSATKSDQLVCLDGMRAISLTWVIIVHEYMNIWLGPVDISTKAEEAMADESITFTIGGTLAVDTFFVIGGLVTVYSFLRSVDRGAKFNILSYYCYRYIRLTAVLAIIILVHATLLKNFGEGPMWNTLDDQLVAPCKKSYWAALLYIQNYVHDQCVPPSWYLSVDMQLFILSPIVLIPLKRKPKWTLVGLAVLSVAGVVVPFFIAFYGELSAFALFNFVHLKKYMFIYYKQTYARFGPYVNGMILGYFIHKVKTEEIKIKLKWIIVMFLWAVCLAGCLACVYAGYDMLISEYNKWSHSIYISFSRTAWSLAVSGIIFLCVSGYGGPIDVFLSAPIFQFLSKISYTVCLVHYSLICVRVYSYKTVYPVGYFYIFFNFWGDFIFSVALSVVLYLTFEAPMVNVAKLLLGKEAMNIRIRSKSNA